MLKRSARLIRPTTAASKAAMASATLGFAPLGAPARRPLVFFTSAANAPTTLMEQILRFSPNAERGSLLYLPRDWLYRVLMFVATAFFAGTYLIIANWIYSGYCDLWWGVYGIDDDDDDD